MTDALAGVNTRTTDQQKRADPIQVENSAGGFVFAVTPETRLRRFLTLGVDGGTFYIGERELTEQNAEVVLDFARNRTADLVSQVVAISEAGRAPKQNPAIFGLAAACAYGDPEGKDAAYAALPRVCRTGTALFLFVKYAQAMRGWGPAHRRGVGRWYTGKAMGDLAYQLVKYRQRESWTHRDVLRKAHPKIDTDLNDLLGWVAHPDGGVAPGIPILTAYLDAQRATTAAEWVEIIDRHVGLSWEMLPDAALGERAVWEALLTHGVPQTALMRQLPRLTNLGLFGPGSNYTGMVVGQLVDPERLRKARVHPVAVLIAQRTYAAGQGTRSTWTPAPRITDALNDAFYAAFGAVERTDKRLLLALDVSGSMGSPIPTRRTKRGWDFMPITHREAAAALALVTAAVEPNTTIVGFTTGDGRWRQSRSFYNSVLTPLN